jgi:alkyldihydroxyacetonephosphate synthase
VASIRGTALRILRTHGAFPLGRGVGKTWSKDKYNIPYLRDFIMDYGCMADVAETAATWANVVPLYHGSVRALEEQFSRDKLSGYVGCHISHTYKTGACLYFTYATVQKPGRELEHYYGYKRRVTEAFLDHGGTLSHHHAIGCEHLPWMEREVGPTGLQALRAVKKSLDPKGIFNPGKLLAETAPPADHALENGATRGVEKRGTPVETSV